MEAIIIAVRAIEAKDAEIAARDAEAAARRAKDAQRKKERRNVPGKSTDIPETIHGRSTDAAGTEEQFPSPSPSPSFPPHPQTNPTHTPTRENTPHTRKGTRLSEDWQPDQIIGPTADMVACWPPGTIERELEKFRNYWLAKSGKDAVKTNWQRTWINWLISADERIGKHGNDRSGRNYRHGPGDGFTDALQIAAGH